MQPILFHKAVFIDKDGTLIQDVPHNVDLRRVRFSEGAFDALALLQHLGFKLIVITNQSGVAQGFFKSAQVEAVGQHLSDQLAVHGIQLSGFYYCPHDEHGSVPDFAIPCPCRKPNPGLLLQAAMDHNIDLAASWMIGDILNDVEAGNRAGCQSILLDVNHETEWLDGSHREPGYIAPTLLAAALHIRERTTRYADVQFSIPREVIA